MHRRALRFVLPGLILAASWAESAGAQTAFHGVVTDAATHKPVPGAHVVLDSVSVVTTTGDGAFDFGELADGPHTLVVQHVAYLPRRVTFQWPIATPFAVELQPRVYEVQPVKVTAARPVPSLPVSAVEFDRQANTVTAGNIASDPLRTVQAHPSAATAGIDFLSAMAIRGGDTEELRVFLDEFPLRHYAHLGGFSSVVYDDMLRATTLVPGAPPPRYHGSLSGIILFDTQEPDTHSVSLRYDITSLAAGLNHALSPSFKVQASGKGSTFNLPVYQQVGVASRSFRDAMVRAVWTPRESLTVSPLLLVAGDSETGSQLSGTSRERETSSAVAGVEVAADVHGWTATVRPQYSYYESSDALTWAQAPIEHRLDEVRVDGGIDRQGDVVGAALTGEVAGITHDGNGGRDTDTPFAAAGELRFLLRDAAALVAGVGVTREEWTTDIEPEAYASLRLNLGSRFTIEGAARRSHQTPLRYSELRYFASIPIDAGDLARGMAGDVHSIRMDQASVEAKIRLPASISLEGNGFWREYGDLPTWDWSGFPVPSNVAHGGPGHGNGFELVLARRMPARIAFALTASRARVWKREGTLAVERIGDYDKPDGYQAAVTARLTQDLRLSVRWTDVTGLPFTNYQAQSTPPTDEQINADRIARFQRLDVKLSVETYSAPFHVTVYLDLVNLLNHYNVATMYALETSPGVFTSAPYGGTKFFPIGGVTVRW